MSPPGRPKGEYRKAKPEGTPVSLCPIARTAPIRGGAAVLRRPAPR